jgi:hypothetical protein
MIKKFRIEPPNLITRHAGESRHPRLAGHASSNEVGMTKVSKRFFFEKKAPRLGKQKTFGPSPSSFHRPWLNLQKFFASPGGAPFFQKRSAFFPYFIYFA